MLPPISLRFASAGHDAEYSSVFLRDGTAWCARGCEALMLVFRQAGFTRSDRILLPAFHCPSITEAIHRAGLQAEYHQVNADLTPVASDVAERLRAGARTLLLIHYFGFRQDAELYRRLCDMHGALLIEDCAHTYFGIAGQPLPGEIGHYAIASTRKLFPLPDGGAAISKSGQVDDRTLRPVPWLEEGRRLLRAIQQAANFGRLGTLSKPASGILDLVDRLRHRTAETPSNHSNCPPSTDQGRASDQALTRTSRVARSLTRMTNVTRLARVRRQNYSALVAGLQSFKGCYPLFPELPAGTIPYVLPLILRDPAQAFPALKARGVPMFRWEGIDGLGCNVTDAYVAQLIQLPCHQELRPDDIDWILDELRRVTEHQPA